MKRAVPWLLLCIVGCPKADDAKPKPDAPASEPPAIVVSAAKKDLVFSYFDETAGGFQSATAIGDVPETARRQVVVVDLSLSPEARQADRYVYITDLTRPKSDGTYPVAIASRFGFEAQLTGTSTAGVATTGESVIVYSASWCGVCKRAKRFLKQKGVPFVEKDIEASRKAKEELARKAAAAGFRPGGVPVIDVAGTILQGLDETTLEGALKDKGFL